MAFSDDLDMNGTADADGIQAGDRSEHYFYAGWRLVETRDGSDNTLGQLVYGTRYIDEPIAYDRNTDVTLGGSADDDCLDASGSQRYTYHQDANWRVVAVTDESGAVVERYDYTAYGEPTILCGTAASAVESGNALLVSGVGNPLMHQGLFRDDETGTYQNRFRQLHSRSGRFMQRDPLGYANAENLYDYLLAGPASHCDPSGLEIVVAGNEKRRKVICAWIQSLCPQATCDPRTGQVTIPDTASSQPTTCPTSSGPASAPPGSPKACAALKKLIDSEGRFVIDTGSPRTGGTLEKQDGDFVKGRFFPPHDNRNRGRFRANIQINAAHQTTVTDEDGSSRTLGSGTTDNAEVLIHEVIHAVRFLEGNKNPDNDADENETKATANPIHDELGIPRRKLD